MTKIRKNLFTNIDAVIKDDSSQWKENFNIEGYLTEDECQQWLNDIVTSFNSSLRPNEQPRTLVSFTFEHKLQYFKSCEKSTKL